MALYYTVWSTAAEVANGPVLARGEIAIGGGSLNSTDVVDPNASPDNQGRRVRIYAEANCFVAWGAGEPTVADGSDGIPMGADNPEYFDIPANQKIAVIQRV